MHKYYESALSLAFNATTEKAVESEGFVEFVEALVDQVRESLEDDETSPVFEEFFQAPITETVVSYNIGELMQAASVQQQHALSASSINKLLTDPDIGFLRANVPILLQRPEVVRLPDGTVKMTGGNHRLAMLWYMLQRGGASEEEIEAVSVQCRELSVDIDALRQKMTAYDEDDNPVLPKEKELLEAIDDIVYQLLVSSNASRTMNSTEKADTRLSLRNIDRNSLAGISQALAEERISKPVACKYAFELGAKEARRPEGKLTAQYLDAQFDFGEFGERVSLKLKTVSSIVSAFFRQLSAIKSDVEGYKSPVSVYRNDLGNLENAWQVGRNVFNTDTPTGLSLFESTVIQVNNELRATNSEYAGNIARNASAIGAALAEAYDAEFEPIDPVLPKGEKPARKSNKRAVKRPLAINI